MASSDWHEPLVLGIARGGVVVAEAVAEVLDAPLDVVVARKIGAPGHPEFGLGAVTSSGETVYVEQSLRSLGLAPGELDETRSAEQAEAGRRESAYLPARQRVPREGRDVLLIDDGLATGVTACAAARTVRRENPRSLVFAVPVGAPDAVERMAEEVDDVVSLAQPPDFRAVGEWYAHFGQTTDDEVVALLSGSR